MRLQEALAALALTFTISSAHADLETKKFKFTFKDTELTKIIEVLAKESDHPFVVDPSIMAKATIHSSKPVTINEALHLLKLAVESNGYAISDRGNVTYVTKRKYAVAPPDSTSSKVPARPDELDRLFGD